MKELSGKRSITGRIMTAVGGLVVIVCLWAAIELGSNTDLSQAYNNIQRAAIALDLKDMEIQLWLLSKGSVTRHHALQAETIFPTLTEYPELMKRWSKLQAHITELHRLGSQGKWQKAKIRYRSQLKPEFKSVTAALSKTSDLLKSNLSTRRTQLLMVLGCAPLGIALLIIGAVMSSDPQASSQSLHTTEEEMLNHLTRLKKQLEEVRDKERKALAFDLHDGLLQYIVAAEMQISNYEATRSSNTQDPDAPGLKRAIEALRAAVEEGRRLIENLHPAGLERSGLSGAIRNLLTTLERETNWSIRFDTDLEELPNSHTKELDTQIYRIISEAICNARKHSATESLAVTMYKKNDRLAIRIQDWGKGFDPQLASTKGLGLHSMRSRTEQLGGTFILDTEPGRGTRIDLIIPYPDPGSGPVTETEEISDHSTQAK